MKTTALISMQVFLLSVPLFSLGQTISDERELVGRILSATCNWPTGLGEVEVEVINDLEPRFELHYYNVLNNRLCIQGQSGMFAQPLTQFAFESVNQLSLDNNSTPTNLYQFRLNRNNVVIGIQKISISDNLRREIQKGNRLRRTGLPSSDYRAIPAMGAHQHPEKVLELRKVNDIVLTE